MSNVSIETGGLAERLKRPRLQFSLLALLMFVCFAGATIGIFLKRLRYDWRERRLYEAEEAALQGTWESEGGGIILVLKNQTFELRRQFPFSEYHATYGTFEIDLAASPKTIDFLDRDNNGHWRRVTHGYSLSGGTLSLWPIQINNTAGQRKLRAKGVYEYQFLLHRRLPNRARSKS